jgi:putative ABC transport system permease protein
LARGRFFADYDHVDRVIVLGQAVARELSAPGVGVGETVLLGMNPITVVGVLEPQGVNFAGEDEDHQVFIPLASYVRRIANRPWLNHVYLRLRSGANSESFVRRVGTVLRDRHERRRDQVDDAIVRNLADVAAEQTSLLATTTWAVTATSGLLLIMGVVGIATLMLLVVRQRRSEVGLRRALGATPADIAVQFFLEGETLATVGVFAGVLVGGGLSLLISALARTPVEVDAKLPLIGAAASLIASAVACLVPAISAALLDPANALRS